MQIATVEVPENHMGPVVELLGKRRGQMFDMQGVGYALFPWPSLYFIRKVVGVHSFFRHLMMNVNP